MAIIGIKAKQKEIANSEKLLNELIAAKNKMYSLNVIHPKYRNLVAVSAFYDFFNIKILSFSLPVT